MTSHTGEQRPIASRLQLPPGPWATILQALCDIFPRIGTDEWRSRMLEGQVLDAAGAPLGVDAPYRVGMQVQYFRRVVDEASLPFEETLLHHDDHLVVADKPAFMPVTPSGAYLEHTLLRRLVRRLGNHDLVPLHRIDRATSGLVLFSANPSSRGAYQALFRERRIRKDYLALARPLPGLAMPHLHRSRLVPGEPFFRMREVDGTANSETRVELDGEQGSLWRYRLTPITGRKHQLRVHMASLGAPIANDRLYPDLAEPAPDDPERPLALLACGLAFEDPVTGEPRSFQSERKL